MIRRHTPLLVARLALAFLALRADPALAGPDGTAFAAIALFGSSAPTYALCPATARSRSDCVRAGKAGASAAIASLRSAALEPGITRVVVFLPGFRTKFVSGRASAQRIAHILGPQFLVVLVDWGSHGSAAGYGLDGAEAKRQTPAFAALVTDLHRALPERALDVFAHSMGCRVAAGAMVTVAPPRGRHAIVTETVFAAPDMALRDYERAILREPEPFGRITIYASRRDRALLVSSLIHLHERIGQLAVWRKPLADTSIVDASAADPKSAGYALHDSPVIRDIGEVFLEAPIPHPAWTASSFGGTVWTLVPSRVPLH